jgi:Uma2 family endonuclease
VSENAEKTFSEVLAKAAERDGYKVEWYAGKIIIQASASAFHNLIITDTIRQIPSDQWWALPDMGVGTPGDHRGPQPDIALVPYGSLDGDENPVSKELVAAVFEVVSKNTRSEDYGDKPETYASMGIPIYVIIDRKCSIVRVFSEPEGRAYARETTSAFGKPFILPAPVELTIETATYPGDGHSR